MSQSHLPSTSEAAPDPMAQLQGHLQAQMAAMQQMGQAYQAQQQQLVALQQEIHQLHATAAAPGAPPAGAPNPVRLADDDAHFGLNRLLSKPSTFDGGHGRKVFDWTSEFDMLFENCDARMPEARKITFAKQFLREEALRWWMARERDVQHGHASLLNTWSAFKTELQKYFSPRGASEGARTELHALRQRQFRSLAAYADYFEATARCISVPQGQSIDAELVTAFKFGLSDGQIRLFLTNANPQTLFEATQQALAAESDLRVSTYHAPTRFQNHGIARKFHSSGGNANTNRRGLSQYHAWHRDEPRHGLTAYGGTSTTAHESAPMDLGLMRSGSADSGGSDPESPAPSGLSVESDGARSESDSDSDPQQRDGFKVSSLQDAKEQDAAQPCLHCGCNLLHMPRRVPRSGKDKCWNCGQLGHVSRNCPKPHQQQYAPSSERAAGHRKGDKPKPQNF